MTFLVRGLPYMGSKNQIADWVLSEISEKIVNTQDFHFIDAFGGGGALSVASSLSGKFKSVTYNEISTQIFEFVKLCQENPEVVKEWTKLWVSSADYHKYSKDPTAWGGFIALVWSFGRRGMSYIYSLESESFKKQYFEYLQNPTQQNWEKLGREGYVLDFEAEQEKDLWQRMISVENQYSTKLSSLPKELRSKLDGLKKDFQEVRSVVKRAEAEIFSEYLKSLGLTKNVINEALGDKRLGNSFLTESQSLKVPTLKQWEILQEALNLEPLTDELTEILVNSEQNRYFRAWLSTNPVYLEAKSLGFDMKDNWLASHFSTQHQLKVENFLNSPKFSLNNSSYLDLNITQDTLVYCDPPYENTGTYTNQKFIQKEFLAWVEKLTDDGVPVFVSEYAETLPGLTKIASIPKRGSIHIKTGFKNPKVVTENLFWNGIK